MWSTSSRSAALAVLLTFASGSAQAQYVAGFSVDANSAFDNNPTSPLNISGGRSRPLEGAYSLYPSLQLRHASSGEFSFGAGYSLGLTRRASDPPLTQHSHSGRFNVSARLSRKWTATVADSFVSSADTATFNALRGVAAAPEQPFLFDPVSARVTSHSNGLQLGLGWGIDPRTSVNVGLSHSLRTYGGNSGAAAAALSNQQGFNASVSFGRQLRERDQWSLSYSGSYATFDRFESSRSHTGRIGYSLSLTPSTRAAVSVGASQVQNVGRSNGYVGYNGSASLTRALPGLTRDQQEGTLSLSYSQDSGQLSGLGSVSNTRRLGVGWRQELTRAVAVFLDTATYETRGALDNTHNARAYLGNASAGYRLSSKLSLRAGAQFQRYSQNVLFAFTQKRFFVALRYDEPEFWSFGR